MQRIMCVCVGGVAWGRSSNEVRSWLPMRACGVLWHRGSSEVHQLAGVQQTDLRAIQLRALHTRGSIHSPKLALVGQNQRQRQRRPHAYSREEIACATLGAAADALRTARTMSGFPETSMRCCSRRASAGRADFATGFIGDAERARGGPSPPRGWPPLPPSTTTLPSTTSRMRASAAAGATTSLAPIFLPLALLAVTAAARAAATALAAFAPLTALAVLLLRASWLLARRAPLAATVPLAPPSPDAAGLEVWRAPLAAASTVAALAPAVAGGGGVADDSGRSSGSTYTSNSSAWATLPIASRNRTSKVCVWRAIAATTSATPNRVSSGGRHVDAQFSCLFDRPSRTSGLAARRASSAVGAHRSARLHGIHTLTDQAPRR